MSFSVQQVPLKLEYCGSSFSQLFAQRRNLLNPRFIRMLGQVDRFNRQAADALDNPRWTAATLREYVEARGYGRDLLDLYLVPMSAAVWSASQQAMLDFPAQTLLRFFHNHGFLGMHTQHPWRTVEGGAQSYVQRLIAPFTRHVLTAQPVTRVVRQLHR
jgi:predicted NAD/FAD-binding protein